jgi:hypothetical protein
MQTWYNNLLYDKSFFEKICEIQFAIYVKYGRC